LLDKVLHSHPNIICASQAYPVLFYYVKQQFLQSRGLERRYPLDHLFLENGYTPDEFSEFLADFVLGPDQLRAFLEQMAAFPSGVWTPELLQYKEEIRSGTFWEVLSQLNSFICRLFPKASALYTGSKEIMVEEYIPYFLSKGAKVVLIIRDPRDVIASTNYTKESPMGANRPVLYGLRSWRRSVAFALACNSNPNFAWTTYEELVRETRATLDSLTNTLGLTEYPIDSFNEGIRDQHGKFWKSNSSFGSTFGFDTGAVGRFSTRLPNETIAYIEAACYPEMRTLGYAFSLVDRFDPAALREYREPFIVTHGKFTNQQDYSSDAVRVSNECERVRLYLEGDALSPEELRRWFIHPETYTRLRTTVR
jgi:hypothetical protein